MIQWRREWATKNEKTAYKYVREDVTMKNRFNNTLNTGKKRSGIFALLALILCTALAGGLTACKADTGNNSVDNPDNKNSEKQIGYIYSFNTTNNGFEFDEIEWICNPPKSL